MITCALLAFMCSYGTGDGWKAHAGNLALLVSAGSSLALERWLMRDRGVRLRLFAPVNIHKKLAKKYWPLILVLLVPLPFGLYWLLGRPYWQVFLVLLTGMVSLVILGDYWYRKQYDEKATPSTAGASTQFQMLAVLAGAKEVELGYFEDHFGGGKGDLRQDIETLQQAGYVSSRQVGTDRKSATLFAMTPHGRYSFNHYRASLLTAAN